MYTANHPNPWKCTRWIIYYILYRNVCESWKTVDWDNHSKMFFSKCKTSNQDNNSPIEI